jgi:hypothetical protein
MKSTSHDKLESKEMEQLPEPKDLCFVRSAENSDTFSSFPQFDEVSTLTQ